MFYTTTKFFIFSTDAGFDLDGVQFDFKRLKLALNGVQIGLKKL